MEAHEHVYIRTCLFLICQSRFTNIDNHYNYARLPNLNAVATPSEYKVGTTACAQTHSVLGNTLISKQRCLAVNCMFLGYAWQWLYTYLSDTRQDEMLQGVSAYKRRHAHKILKEGKTQFPITAVVEHLHTTHDKYIMLYHAINRACCECHILAEMPRLLCTERCTCCKGQ
jgi:hypothetical protein